MDEHSDPPQLDRALSEAALLGGNAIERALEGLLAVANDPERFAELRRRLLDGYINSISASRQQGVLSQQSEIDQLRAISGTPMIALAHLLSDLRDHVEVFDRIDMELKKNR